MKNRRATSFFPTEVNSWEVYEDLWWKWWCDVQPKDRPIIAGRPSFMEKNTFDWEEINFWGQNGLVLVVFALAWWGKVLNGQGGVAREVSSWTVAVRDVTWVLWELHLMLSKRRDSQPPAGMGTDDEDDGELEGIVPLSPTRKNKRNADNDDLPQPASKRARVAAGGRENIVAQAALSPRRTRSRHV